MAVVGEGDVARTGAACSAAIQVVAAAVRKAKMRPGAAATRSARAVSGS